MPTFSAKLDVSGTTQAIAAADAEILRDARQLLQLLGIEMLANVALAFEQKMSGGMGEDGIAWAPLDPKTVKAKRRRGAPSGAVSIGVDTGLMRASGSPGDPSNVFDLGDTFVEVGYGMEYSRFFDEKRTLIVDELPTDWQDDLDGIAEDWLTDKLAGLD